MIGTGGFPTDAVFIRRRDILILISQAAFDASSADEERFEALARRALEKLDAVISRTTLSEGL